MSSKPKPKNQLRIPQQQAVLVDKRTVTSRRQYQMAVDLLGDVQRYLVYICSAVRQHRERKWHGEDVECHNDARLYAALDEVVEEYSKPKGRHKKKKQMVS